MPTYPNGSQIYAALPLVNMRPMAALRELINICRQSLNGGVVQLNTELGLTGTQAIPTYQGFYLAPANLSDKYLNSLVIDWRLAYSPQGMQDQNQIIDLSLIDVIGRASDQIISDVWDRTGAIDGTLYYARNGWPNANIGSADPDGKVFWVQLLPVGVEPLRDAQNQFYGTVSRYRMVLGSGVNNWQ